ncbi:MAG: Chromosome partition protein Smc [Fimbriimonadales bacterium]|nr:Chromosome partition protein Smc [Fimbriimonadales bacterium]
MRLLRLSLKNFRQFRDAEVEFRDGVVAIVGANGSGKSTVLEAISWALYGAHRNKKATIRRLWAEADEPTEVTLEAQIRGAHYRFVRSLRTATVSLEDGGRAVLASGLEACTEFAEKLLGLNYVQFKNSYCTNQKDIAFLQFPTERRKSDEVGRMLGLQVLERAAKLGKERERDFRQASEAMSVDEEAVRAAESRVQSVKQELAKIEAQRKEAIEQLDALQKEHADRADMAKKAQRAIELEDSIAARRELGIKLKRDVDSFREELETRKATVQRLQGLREAAEKYESLEKTRRELEAARAAATRKESLLNEARIHEQEAERAEAQLAGLPAVALDEIESAVRSAKEKRSDEESRLLTSQRDVAKRHQELYAEQTTLRDRVANLERREESELSAIQDGRCPTCGQPLPEGKLPTTEALRKEIERWQEDLRGVDQRLLELEEERKQIEARQKEIESLRQQEVEAEAQLARAKAEQDHRSKLTAQLEAAKKRAKQAREEAEAIPIAGEAQSLDEVAKESDQLKPVWVEFQSLGDHQKEFQNLAGRLAEAEKQFEAERAKQNEAKEELKEIGMTREECQRVLEEAASRSERIRELEKLRDVESARKDSTEKMLAMAVSELEGLEDRHKSAKASEMEAKLHGAAAKALLELREQLNSAARPELERIASDILQGLSGGRYMALSLDDDYEPTLLDEDVAKDVISGGESDIVALALRLALARMMQDRAGSPMGLLILDEVFGSLDAYRRHSVMEQIGSLREHFEQILLISHIDDINEAADTCLVVRYDLDKKESTITERVEDLEFV